MNFRVYHDETAREERELNFNSSKVISWLEKANYVEWTMNDVLIQCETGLLLLISSNNGKKISSLY